MVGCRVEKLIRSIVKFKLIVYQNSLVNEVIEVEVNEKLVGVFSRNLNIRDQHELPP